MAEMVFSGGRGILSYIMMVATALLGFALSVMTYQVIIGSVDAAIYLGFTLISGFFMWFFLSLTSARYIFHKRFLQINAPCFWYRGVYVKERIIYDEITDVGYLEEKRFSYLRKGGLKWDKRFLIICTGSNSGKKVILETNMKRKMLSGDYTKTYMLSPEKHEEFIRELKRRSRIS